MKNRFFLFVYGTLRSHYNNPYANLLRDNADFIGDAVIKGLLVDVGEYPGLIPTEANVSFVKGEVYELKDSSILLKELDEYEGDEYERRRLEVTFNNGEKAESWVYVYKSNLPFRQIIESGDYVQYRPNIATPDVIR